MRRGFCVLHHTDKPYSAGLRIGTLERPTNPDLPAPLGSADKRSGQLSAHASTGSCPCHILAQAASKTAASLAAPFGKQEQQVHDIAATAETKGFVGERPDKTQVRKNLNARHDTSIERAYIFCISGVSAMLLLRLYEGIVRDHPPVY